MDLQSFLLFVLFEDEFEQSEHLAKHKKGHFVITKSVKRCKIIMQQKLHGKLALTFIVTG